jgi:hypothetical protein
MSDRSVLKFQTLISKISFYRVFEFNDSYQPRHLEIASLMHNLIVSGDYFDADEQENTYIQQRTKFFG